MLSFQTCGILPPLGPLTNKPNLPAWQSLLLTSPALPTHDGIRQTCPWKALEHAHLPLPPLPSPHSPPPPSSSLAGLRGQCAQRERRAAAQPTPPIPPSIPPQPAPPAWPERLLCAPTLTLPDAYCSRNQPFPTCTTSFGSVPCPAARPPPPTVLVPPSPDPTHPPSHPASRPPQVIFRPAAADC